ncbi:MAG: hypothetical protein HY424_03070 [Candidatus Levybacteria bacterium]|nr:hypothetical protein [Candidatus Levybacteria bacterium]
MEKNGPTQKEPLVHSLDNSMSNSIFTQKLFIFLLIAVVLGGITGYALSRKGASGNTLTSGSVNSSEITKGTIVGSDDTKTFKDTAIGKLEKGGINGEGQFHLTRTGGESQNVYLTSSSVDLSKFVGRKIKVWGETQKAQYAGWLMDVGRVEVTE